jgi:uncharacterized phage-associated protein
MNAPPQSRQKAPIVRLQPNKQRVLESVRVVITEAAKREKPVTQYSILKALFLADRAHLNRYGRPITFDNYMAMKDGPVASFAYDLLKGDVSFPKEFGVKQAPWKVRPAPDISPKALVFHSPTRGPSEDVLSETDVEEIANALTIVLSLSFKQLRLLTHEDQAYIDAWEAEGTKQSYPMSIGMLFEVPNFDEAQNLALVSKHLPDYPD